MTWPKRLYSLDISRGVAALAVVLWHWQHFAFVGTLRPAVFDERTQPFYDLLRLFYQKGQLGVDYFFLLSGFVFFWLYGQAVNRQEMTFCSFMLRRFARLYPLHLVTLCLVGALQLVYLGTTNSYFVYPYNDTYHFVLNVFLVNGWGLERGWSFNAPVWAVSVEVALYGAFFLLARLQKRTAATCLVISLASFAWSCVPGTNGLVCRGGACFFFGGFSFHVTAFIANYMPRARWVVYSVCLTSWFLALVSVYGVDVSGYLSGHTGALGAVAARAFPCYILFASTVCSLALGELGSRQILRRLAWMGEISYSSYLLHFPLALVCSLSAKQGLMPNNFYTHWASLGAFFAVLVTISYLSVRRFERPCQEWFRRSDAERVSSDAP